MATRKMSRKKKPSAPKKKMLNDHSIVSIQKNGRDALALLQEKGFPNASKSVLEDVASQINRLVETANSLLLPPQAAKLFDGKPIINPFTILKFQAALAAGLVDWIYESIQTFGTQVDEDDMMTKEELETIRNPTPRRETRKPTKTKATAKLRTTRKKKASKKPTKRKRA
jgi:hypothetical protein